MSAKRYATQELARIEVYGHNSFMTARMKNLSSTGAFFEISQASFLPKAGDLINVTVRLNTLAKERHVSAEVVRVMNFERTCERLKLLREAARNKCQP